MFRFEEPAYLYLLLLLPLLAAFYLYSNYRRRKNIRKFGDPELMAQLMPDVSKYRPDVKFWMVFVAIGLFSVLLARPQFGSKLETVKRQGVEVMIALDISNSMLAQDVQPSRLQKAKRLVAQFRTKLRTRQQYRKQTDSNKYHPKLHIRTILGYVRHQLCHQFRITEFADILPSPIIGIQVEGC
jgi:hypothetical protein